MKSAGASIPTTPAALTRCVSDRKMQWKEWMYGRKSKLREEDTDWKRWLLGKPDAPFDPHVYLEFRLYKKYSSGIFDQWMSHGCDLVHI